MNIFTSFEEIIQYPITQKERNHHKRNRRGYHVFLSLYFSRFGSLNEDRKRQILRELGIWNMDGYESDESVMTPPSPSSWHVMKAAASEWSEMQSELKRGWKERADRLNSRPLSDGTFEAVPEFINDMAVKTALTKDWQYFVGMMRQSIIQNVDRFNVERAEIEYKFGNERVKLQSQKYRSFYLNHLLKLTIFGCPLYSHLLGHEIPFHNKKGAIVFFYSYRRMTEVFDFGGLKGTVFYRNDKKYFCCPKVNMKNQRGQNIVGYVVDEVNDTLRVKLVGEEVIICTPRPEYDYENGCFLYERQRTVSTYQLTEMWPIRMKLNETGQSSLIMNTNAHVDEDNDNIVNI